MNSKQGPREVGMCTPVTSPKGAGRHTVAVQSEARDGPEARDAAGHRHDGVRVMTETEEVAA